MVYRFRHPFTGIEPEHFYLHAGKVSRRGGRPFQRQ